MYHWEVRIEGNQITYISDVYMYMYVCMYIYNIQYICVYIYIYIYIICYVQSKYGLQHTSNILGKINNVLTHQQIKLNQ